MALLNSNSLYLKVSSILKDSFQVLEWTFLLGILKAIIEKYPEKVFQLILAIVYCILYLLLLFYIFAQAANFTMDKFPRQIKYRNQIVSFLIMLIGATISVLLSEFIKQSVLNKLF
jgi:hypothetical protein